ncbi:MAG: hypothetical protein RO469_11575 [Thermincola sp.]|nr:hypothetical protein [Thermincola sp.]
MATAITLPILTPPVKPIIYEQLISTKTFEFLYFEDIYINFYGFLRHFGKLKKTRKARLVQFPQSAPFTPWVSIAVTSKLLTAIDVQHTLAFSIAELFQRQRLTDPACPSRLQMWKKYFPAV